MADLVRRSYNGVRTLTETQAMARQRSTYTVIGGCVLCATCETVCPVKAVRLDADGAHIDPAVCTGCGRCFENCPAEAIARVEPAADETKEEKQ